MQVVTSENMQQLIETGKVDEFKPPEAPKASEAKLRGEDGKFVSVEPGKETVDTVSENGDKQDTASPTDAGDEKPDGQAVEKSEDDDLPERARKRIAKKHREKMEAEEFGEREFDRRKAAERRAEELETRIKALEGSKSGPEPTKDSKEPKPDDFKTVAEYADALVDYKLNQREQKAEEKRQAAAQTEANKALNTRIAKAAAEIPDYKEVMADADIDAPGHIAQYLAESDLGPQVGYHLVKNRGEYDRISQLSPIRAIAELGKLEKSLEKPVKAETTKAPTVSKAPSPITPLDSSRATTVETDPAKMSLQQLREYERDQSRKRNR